MALNVVATGEVVALSRLVNLTASANLELHLFKSNTTITDATVVADLTETSASGYASQTLIGATWTVATSTANVTTASYPTRTFTFSASEDIYGYYVTTASAAALVYAEAFASGVFSIPSGTMAISPRITAD